MKSIAIISLVVSMASIAFALYTKITLQNKYTRAIMDMHRMASGKQLWRKVDSVGPNGEIYYAGPDLWHKEGDPEPKIYPFRVGPAIDSSGTVQVRPIYIVERTTNN